MAKREIIEDEFDRRLVRAYEVYYATLYPVGDEDDTLLFLTDY